MGSLQRGWSVYEALTPPPEVTSYIPHLTTPPRSPRGCKPPWVALPTIIVLRWSVNYLTTSTSFLYYNDQKIVLKCNIQQALKHFYNNYIWIPVTMSTKTEIFFSDSVNDEALPCRQWSAVINATVYPLIRV